MRRGRGHAAEAGVTLMELLIAITLLSMLTMGMMIAMRVGLGALAKTNTRLMDNRRVAGAQRIVEQQLEGLMPVMSPCGGGPEAAGPKMPFFQGEVQSMRLVSTFSLQQGWRGQPQILEMFVIPGEGGKGVRLVVNEFPYTGPLSTAALCGGRMPDPVAGGMMSTFAPVVAGPRSFVLADQLAYCRFSYFAPGAQPTDPPAWRSRFGAAGWPLGIRIVMAPISPDAARLQPVTITAPIQLSRVPELPYADN